MEEKYIIYCQDSKDYLAIKDERFLCINNYCCPVNFQTAQESSPKPFRIGLRGFFFKKQAP